MKELQDLVVTVADFGSFICLAKKISETCKVNYHSPIEREFRSITNATIGYGIKGLTKIESFMHPDVVKETDLYVFPDIGYEGEQKYLKSIGKSVWGSNGGDELEMLRTKFIKVIEELGLPMVHTQKIVGLDALEDYLREHENVWVKIDEFRDDMETWHHQDLEHSQPELCALAESFGGMAPLVRFVVQDDLPGATEIGYDGWSIDGWFPDSSYQGYEKKNELYLGAQTHYNALPEEVRLVNEKFSKELQAYGYRNFFATEIRNLAGTPYFIDPTMRMPGQTGEQLMETLENLVEVIWKGAQGEVVEPKWNAKFAASATLNYKGDLKQWKVAKIPEDVERWVKLCCYGVRDGYCHFPPSKRPDVGVVIAIADTIEGVIAGIKENFDAIGDDDLSIQYDGFVDLLSNIQQAEEEGIEFTKQEVPEPESVIANE